MENRFNDLLNLIEGDTALRMLELSGKRRDVVIEALRIAANSQLAPIENASDIEKRICGRLVSDLLADGYSITIYNGGDEAELTKSTDEATIYAAMAATDQDELVIHSGPTAKRAGWVRLVYGNDVDVISDYTTNLDKVLAGANALANELDS